MKLNAKQLLDRLTELSIENDLSNVQVNFRHDDDSDVYGISVVEEDLYDEMTNSKLESVILKVNGEQ